MTQERPAEIHPREKVSKVGETASINKSLAKDEVGSLTRPMMQSMKMPLKDARKGSLLTLFIVTINNKYCFYLFVIPR